MKAGCFVLLSLQLTEIAQIATSSKERAALFLGRDGIADVLGRVVAVSFQRLIAWRPVYEYFRRRLRRSR